MFKNADHSLKFNNESFQNFLNGRNFAKTKAMFSVVDRACDIIVRPVDYATKGPFHKIDRTVLSHASAKYKTEHVCAVNC